MPDVCEAEARTDTDTAATVVVAEARAAQQVWARLGAGERARRVLRLHDLVLERRREVAGVVEQATGKTRRDAFLEVAAALTIARYYGIGGPRLLRDRRHRLDGVFAPLLITGIERRLPLGVVANIAAWNYPLVFMLGDTVAALVAGNAVTLVPDPRSVAVARTVADLTVTAGLPRGLVGYVVGGDPEVSGAVIDAADHVLFTGSTRVGRLVAERAARTLTGVTLELGGKNAAYVARDADLDAAAEALVRDCFGASGQTCTATERLYVHREVHDDFVRRFAERTRRLRIDGVEAGSQADISRLTTPAHLRSVDDLVRDAVSRGATVVAGAVARPELGPAVYEPTILTDVPPDAEVTTTETFGPVVVVYRVGDDDEALRRMNDSDRGLMAALWTRDIAHGRRLAARVRAGTVIVNEAYHVAWGSPAMPLGGVGESGSGRRFGVAGLHAVTRTHVTVVARGGLVRQIFERPAARSEDVVAALAGLMRVLRRP